MTLQLLRGPSAMVTVTTSDIIPGSPEIAPNTVVTQEAYIGTPVHRPEES